MLTGATGGIGHAIARALRAAGSELVLTGRRVDVLEPLALELDARPMAVDLSDRAALHDLAAACADVDVVVANAALPASGSLESFSEEELDRALEVNLTAPMILSRLLAPAMVARGRGHLVFTSSIAGKLATPGSAVYSATKFGLRGFGQGLRQDLHGSGVGVSVIFPGFVREAGMFADTGVELPSYMKTSSPQQVAAAVIRGVTEDRGEIDVAPMSVRASAVLNGLAPGAAAAMLRRAGSGFGDQVIEGQRVKR